MDDVLLTIEGENISFKKKISEQRAGQIIALLSSPSNTATAAPGNVVSIAALSPARTSSMPTARGTRPEVKDLPISSILEGYLGYHELPTKADKILWILQYAETYQLLDLNSVEVDFISRELRDPIDTKNFGAFNQRNQRLGFVMKSKNSFRISNKGRTHLANLAKLHE